MLSLLAPAARAQVKNQDTFVYAITGDVDSLDPHWEFDAVSQEVQLQLYETLIFYKGPSTDAFEPLIASVVPDAANGLLSSDGLKYAFPIRKDVRFHDGTPLTPEDVRYSLMRFVLMDRASGPSFLLQEPILGTTDLLLPDGTVDPTAYARAADAIQVERGAVVIRLKRPFAPLLPILASFCPVVSKTWTASRGGWDGRAETWARLRNPAKQDTPLYDRANGTGPFKLERWDKENKQLVLARHEGYWRKPARLAHLVYKTVNEASTRKLMLQAGDADAVMMERQFLPLVQDLEGVSVQDNLPFLETHNAFVFNFKTNSEANPYIGSGKLDGEGVPNDFFADKDVREGFARAFDYDAYIRDGYRGKGERARGPIPRGVFGHNPRQGVPERDPAAAAEHFQRAFGGRLWQKGFRVTAAYMEGRADRQLACQILKKTVEELNPLFKVDVRGLLWSTWLDAFSAGKLPLVNARWVLDTADPHSAVYAFLHSSGYYAKASGYSNPRADRMIEAARSELDRAKRKALYHELQALAALDLPQLYTLDTYTFQVTRSWVKGLYYNPILLYGYFYQVYKES